MVIVPDLAKAPLGARLRFLRKRRGLSISQLERLTGISHGTISRIERVRTIDICTCICNTICVYSIRLASDVLKDLRKFPTYHQRRILDEVERQLSHEPTAPTRNRKLLVNLAPPWEAEPPIWELRIEEFRVFYDVSEEEKTVYVRAVRRKPAGQSTEDIL